MKAYTVWGLYVPGYGKTVYTLVEGTDSPAEDAELVKLIFAQSYWAAREAAQRHLAKLGAQLH